MIRTVPIGTMRHKMTHEAQVDGARDAHNRPSVTWSVLGYPMCALNRLRGTENMSAGAIEAKASHRITTRARTVSVKDRFVFGSRIFNVVEYDDRLERGRYVDVIVIEEVS